MANSVLLIALISLSPCHCHMEFLSIYSQEQGGIASHPTEVPVYRSHSLKVRQVTLTWDFLFYNALFTCVTSLKSQDNSEGASGLRAAHDID